MAENLLEIQNLCAFAGEKEILKNLSLNIKAGEIHVLMGPNGAGKSTFGYTLMGSGEYTISSGKIFFEGKDITFEEADKRARAGIFLSFQEPLEVPGISLEAFIRSSLQQVSSQKIKLLAFTRELEKQMALLNMNPSYAQRDLNVGFSGGEKKKSEILQLLMLKPKLAVLDETDSGLDVDAVRTVSMGIKEYQKQTGGSLLIITHSTKILESLHVDYAHILVKGRIVHSGDASLIQQINERGFDEFIPEEIKEEERKEKMLAAAKAAMEAVKQNVNNGGLDS